MPYKSLAQAAFFHTHRKQLMKQGVNVSEWDSASKGMKLPKRVKKPMNNSKGIPTLAKAVKQILKKSRR